MSKQAVPHPRYFATVSIKLFAIDDSEARTRVEQLIEELNDLSEDVELVEISRVTFGITSTETIDKP